MARRLQIEPIEVLIAAGLGLAAVGLSIVVAADAGLTVALALAALVVGALALRRPMELIYISILAIPLGTLSTTLGLPFSVGATEVLFGAAGGGWLIRSLVTPDEQRARAPAGLTLPLAMFVLSIAPGLLVAEDPLPVIRQLVLWIPFFAAFLLIATDGDREVVRKVMLSLALTGGVLGLIGLVDPSAVEGRALGPFSNPNVLAMFIAVSIPCQIVLALTEGSAIRFAAVLAAGLAGAGMILTLSRGGLLAAFFAVVLMIAWQPLRRAALVLVLLIPLVVLIGVNPIEAVGGQAAVDRLATLGDESSQPVSQRLESYEKSPGIVYDHPLFGVGVGNFPLVATAYDLTDSGFTSEFGQPHSYPLGIAVSQGFFGLAALLWLSIAGGNALLRCCRRLTGRDQAFAYALVGAFTAAILWGLFHDATRFAPFAALIFALIGCVAILDRYAAERPAAGLSPP